MSVNFFKEVVETSLDYDCVNSFTVVAIKAIFIILEKHSKSSGSGFPFSLFS